MYTAITAQSKAQDAKLDKLVNTMRLTSANLRDLAISVGRTKTVIEGKSYKVIDNPDYSALQQLADRLYNATL